MANKMSYRSAQVIGRQSLSDMIIRNLSDPNKSTVGSFTGAISDKLKAKATRFKERFDPMNIARVLGGGLGAAMYGKLAGRSDEDMQYFTRKGKKGFSQSLDKQAKQNPMLTKISEGQEGRSQKGDGLATVLSRIYNLTKKNIETEKKRHELEVDRSIQKKEEEEKRHQEIIDALKGIGGGKTVTATKETKESGGLFDGLGKMIEDFLKPIKEMIANFKEALEPIFQLMKTLGSSFLSSMLRLGSFLISPVGIALLAGAGAAALLAFLLYNDKNPEQTTKGIINAGATDGGFAEAVIEAANDKIEGRKNNILREATKQGIFKTSWYNFSGRAEEQNQYLKSIGFDGKTGLVQKERDMGYTGIDDDGNPVMVKSETKATPLPSGITPSTAGAGRGSAQAASSDPRRIDAPSTNETSTETPSATPEAPAPSPVTQQLQQAVATNEDAKMDQAMSPNVVSIDASSTKALPATQNGPAITKDVSVSVRTDDSTFWTILKQNLRPV